MTETRPSNTNPNLNLKTLSLGSWHRFFGQTFAVVLLILVPAFSFADKQNQDEARLQAAKRQQLKLQEYQSFAEKFALALQDNDKKKLNELYAYDRFIKKIAVMMSDNENEQKEYINAYAQIRENVFNNLFSSIARKQGTVKYLRNINDNGKLFPLLRLDMPDGGHDYIKLYLGRSKSRQLVVTDFFMATTGKTASRAMVEAMQLMKSSGGSTSMLAKLLNIQKIDKKVVSQIIAIGKLRQQGKFVEAYETYKSLPIHIRQTRVVIEVGVVIALGVSEEAYLKQLEQLAKYYGDEDSTQFMLVDYYFSNKDFKKAMTAINRALKLYGEDAALYNLKASIALQMGDEKLAIRYAKKAIQLEPEFEDATWMLVNIYNTKERFQEMVPVLKSMETDFGYEFSIEDFQAEAFYEEFTKSETFKKWLTTSE